MQKVREVVADAVVSSGTTTVFALMGAANQELICDLGSRGAVRLVHCRHEAGAVGMADGYSRFSERVGVATVTAGPGVTNTATSLAVARAHRSPVLLIAGDTPGQDPRNPQFFDQDAFTRICAGSGGRVEHPGEVGAALRTAADSLTADLPFALHLPADVQEMPAGRPAPADLTASTAADWDAVDDAEAAEAVRLLTAARRPLVLAGRGALDAGVAVSELAELLGAPLVSTLRAAGLFAGHALEAGTAGSMGDGRAQKLLEDADLVLVVGTSLHPLAASALITRRTPAVIVRIDTMPAVDALVCGADLRSDARAGARLLLQRLAASGAHPAPTWHRPTAEARDLADRTCETDGVVHPLEALDALRDLLPAQHLMVIGGGHAALSACQMLPASGPRDFTCVSTDFGAIGQALPVAIGACFARPGERVFHVTADGEFMMALAEFHTAIRYRLPLTVVVLNDHGFGQERHNLKRAGRPAHHADHASPDLVALAQAMGAHGYRITQFSELARLKRAADDDQGVVLVDVRIDPTYLNPASAHVAAVMARHQTIPKGNTRS